MELNSYVPKYLTASEVVPAGFELYWRILIDPRVLITADQIRDFFGVPLMANHDTLHYRGWRPYAWILAEKSAGRRPAEMSQHLFGRALDCDLKGIPAETVRREIISHRDRFPYLTTLENGVGWVHFDVRYTGMDKILIVNP